MSGDALVVTGLGVVSPLGLGARAVHEALRSTPPATAPKRVGDVPSKACLPAAQLRRMDRLSQMIGVAAMSAASEASLAGTSQETAIVIGSALGNLRESVAFLERAFRRPALASPMLFPNLVLNAPAAQLAAALGWRGPNLSVAAGEVSGESALAVAAGLLRRGRARAVLVAAGDELADIVCELLGRLGVSAPAGAPSRPLDERAAGPVPSEGASALVLETAASAGERDVAAIAVLDGVEAFSLPAQPFRWPASASVEPLAGLRGIDAALSGADASLGRDGVERAWLAGFSGPVATWKGPLGEYASSGLLGVVLAAESLRRGELPATGTPGEGSPAARPVGGPVSGALRRIAVTGVTRGGGAAVVRLSVAR